jgi:hypothetical protein
MVPGVRLCLLAVAFSLGACRSAAFTRAEQRDTEDGWRAYLADHDLGVEADAARERLDDRVWAECERVKTPLAYRRYLDEFPAGAHEDDALARLRALRSRPSPNDAEDLDATSGPAVEANFADAALAASASGSSAPLLAFLSRFPDSPRAAALRAREEDLAFAEAARGTLEALRRFLETHPGSRRAAEVEAIIEEREIRALLWEEHFPEAEQRIAALPQGPLAAGLRRELCQRRARADRTSPVELSKLGAEGLALILPDDAAVGALAEGLLSEEAQDVIETAWLLADTGAPATLDPLLRVMEPERSVAVRWTARQVLARIIAGWPPEVREAELDRRRSQLVARAASAALWTEEAVLEEGLGSAEVQATLAKARHDAPEDPLPAALALERADLRDPEKSLVAQQLKNALAGLPSSEGCAQLWLARLVQETSAPPGGLCAEGPTGAALSAQTRRLAALSLLIKRGPLAPSLVAQLGRVAERDGSPEVRAAARSALAGVDTLDTPVCAPVAALLNSPRP